MRSRILFITRNYPPKVGGLEIYSYNLIKGFEAHSKVYKITLSKSNANLFWFFPYSFLKALYLALRHDIRFIHMCDGMLSPVGLLLKIFTGAKVTTSVHGLDITYPNALYQKILPRFIASLDSIVCVSRSTLDICLSRGVPRKKCTVIPNGIRPSEFLLPISRKELRRKVQKITGVSLKGKTVLLSVGHLVKRKGVAWFVENVIPKLNESFIYLVVGDGHEYSRIQEVVNRHSLQNKVLLLGKVPDNVRNLLYNASDIFVMPNIAVPGDVEGFGIVAIEAGSSGLPVIAADVQGIRDAVIHGKTGYLVDERDADGFVKRIKNMDLEKERVRSIVNSTFNWTHICAQYRFVLIPYSGKQNHNTLE